MKRPIVEGGLQVREPGNDNIALGGKILWKLYTNSSHPVSHILKKKYLKGVPLRNIQATNTKNGTMTWNLCRHGLEFFHKDLYHVPRNKNNTLLWHDRIMGFPPLANSEETKGVCTWLIQQEIHKLADIFVWDSIGNWLLWAFPSILEHLNLQKKQLINELTPSTPIHQHAKDKWGWGKTGVYIAL